MEPDHAHNLTSQLHRIGVDAAKINGEALKSEFAATEQLRASFRAEPFEVKIRSPQAKAQSTMPIIEF